MKYEQNLSHLVFFARLFSELPKDLQDDFAYVVDHTDGELTKRQAQSLKNQFNGLNGELDALLERYLKL
jgi:hypothetical protein